MTAKNLNFFTCIYVHNYSLHIYGICEILRNFKLNDFLSNCIKQRTTSIKYWQMLKNSEKLRKNNFFVLFHRSFWWETVLTNFDFIKNFDFILTYKPYQKRLLSTQNQF